MPTIPASARLGNRTRRVPGPHRATPERRPARPGQRPSASRRFGSAPRSRGLGGPWRRRHQPAAATIAALSVQRARPGRNTPIAVLLARLGDPPSQQGVGRHATRKADRGRPDVGCGGTGALHQHVDHRGAERGGDVLGRCVGVLAHGVDHRRLQPAEREVVAAPRKGAGKANAFGSPSSATRSMTGPPG